MGLSQEEIIKQTEKFVQEFMRPIKEEAHKFGHVDRVRKWALKIGEQEGGVDLFLLEMAALLHDVGRVTETSEIDHYVAGEKIARDFLLSLNYFSPKEIDLICLGVRWHGAGHKEKLVKILQDADKMDSLGAIGVIRTATFLGKKPYYIDEKSFTPLNMSQKEIDEKIKQRPWEKSIVDGLNFCLNFSQYFNTETGKRLAKEKTEYLRNFIQQLKKETINL